MALQRIEVAGCIASGKTTFVEALAKPFKPVYEDHGVNPFWEVFYTNPSAHAFETEVTFLLQHYHFAKLAATTAKVPILLDHSFELDIAYAELGLVGDRKTIFESIYREVQSELGWPDVLVFITCGVKEAAKRIRARARPLEADLPFEFLSELSGRLHRRVEEVSARVPVLRVNSEEIDFRKRGSWQSRIVADIEKMLGLGGNKVRSGCGQG